MLFTDAWVSDDQDELKITLEGETIAVSHDVTITLPELSTTDGVTCPNGDYGRFFQIATSLFGSSA